MRIWFVFLMVTGGLVGGGDVEINDEQQNESDFGDCAAQNAPANHVVCHYGGFLSSDKIDACLCTHLMLSDWKVGADLRQLYHRQFRNLDFIKLLKRRNPNLQVGLTLSGSSNDTVWTELVGVESRAKLFAERAASFLSEVGADGIALDWEPSTAQRRDNFTGLVKAFRVALDSESGSDGGAAWLMVNIGRTYAHISHGYDFIQLSRYVDLFYLPAYNFTDDLEKIVHPSPLLGPDGRNADALVDLVLSLNATAKKVILGMPAYGMYYDLKKSEVEDEMPTGRMKIIPYQQICQAIKSVNWTVEREEDKTEPRARNNEAWIGFDDTDSVRIKSKYALLRRLAGVGIWRLDHDDFEGSCNGQPFPLVRAARSIMDELDDADQTRVMRSLEEEMEASSDDVIEVTLGPRTGRSNGNPFRVTQIVDRNGDIHIVEDPSQTKLECTRPGYYRNPDDCSHFYRCVKFNQYKDNFVIFEYDCPKGLVYDERWEVCSWASATAPCGGSTEIQPVPRNKFVCSSEGYFTDPENCRWFYKCSDFLRDGSLTAFEFRCPFDLAFDESNVMCNWRWLVSGCGDSGHDRRPIGPFTGGADAGGVRPGHSLEGNNFPSEQRPIPPTDGDRRYPDGNAGPNGPYNNGPAGPNGPFPEGPAGPDGPFPDGPAGPNGPFPNGDGTYDSGFRDSSNTGGSGDFSHSGGPTRPGGNFNPGESTGSGGNRGPGGNRGSNGQFGPGGSAGSGGQDGHFGAEGPGNFKPGHSIVPHHPGVSKRPHGDNVNTFGPVSTRVPFHPGGSRHPVNSGTFFNPENSDNPFLSGSSRAPHGHESSHGVGVPIGSTTSFGVDGSPHGQNTLNPFHTKGPSRPIGPGGFTDFPDSGETGSAFTNNYDNKFNQEYPGSSRRPSGLFTPENNGNIPFGTRGSHGSKGTSGLEIFTVSSVPLEHGISTRPVGSPSTRKPIFVHPTQPDRHRESFEPDQTGEIGWPSGTGDFNTVTGPSQSSGPWKPSATSRPKITVQPNDITASRWPQPQEQAIPSRDPFIPPFDQTPTTIRRPHGSASTFSPPHGPHGPQSGREGLDDGSWHPNPNQANRRPIITFDSLPIGYIPGRIVGNTKCDTHLNVDGHGDSYGSIQVKGSGNTPGTNQNEYGQGGASGGIHGGSHGGSHHDRFGSEVTPNVAVSNRLGGDRNPGRGRGSRHFTNDYDLITGNGGANVKISTEKSLTSFKSNENQRLVSRGQRTEPSDPLLTTQPSNSLDKNAINNLSEGQLVVSKGPSRSSTASQRQSAVAKGGSLGSGIGFNKVEEEKLSVRWQNITSLVGPVECNRGGLFRHPDDCSLFYECFWDRWLDEFTIHYFECPVRLAFDFRILGCNWPLRGPHCEHDAN